MWWLMSIHALAMTPSQQLEAAAARLPPASATHTGVLHYQGHGKVPGIQSDHNFTATTEGAYTQWAGEGFTDAAWLDGGLWERVDEAWERPDPLRAEAEMIRYLSTDPARLLRHMASQPARLRPLDDEVLWSTPDGLWTLSFADGLPTRLSCERSHPVFGDVVDEVRWERGDDAHVRVAFAEDDTRWWAELRPTTTGPKVPAPSPPMQVQAVSLAPNTWTIDVPESNSRSLLTVAGNAGVVFDVPLSSALGEAVLAEARRAAPAVTEWWVVVSHHHPHYAGGLRPWARAGATLVVPQSIAEQVTQQLTSERRLDPSDPAVPSPRIVGVDATLDLLGGAVSVRAIDEASGHTDGFLMSLLTGPKVLYVGDLASAKEGQVRHRGTWPGLLAPWRPSLVVSGWPLEGTEQAWPFELL